MHVDLLSVSLSLLSVRTGLCIEEEEGGLVEPVSTLEVSPSIIRVNGQGLK
ncbi:uncharacterized protein DS421_20g698590 [Arachis hypogaea]|nr:uncharacterized protein DS421_20g698590 [Arachis hypogaea]